MLTTSRKMETVKIAGYEDRVATGNEMNEVIKVTRRRVIRGLR